VPPGILFAAYWSTPTLPRRSSWHYGLVDPQRRDAPCDRLALVCLVVVCLTDFQIGDDLNRKVRDPVQPRVGMGGMFEAIPRQGNGRYSEFPEPYCVEQTARCARASHTHPCQGDLHLLGHLDYQRIGGRAHP
jgi:hypothetical protein